MEWFRNRLEAKVVIEQWRLHYNEIRPHSSLGNQTPAAFSQSISSTKKPDAVFQE
jgi:putative transposase